MVNGELLMVIEICSFFGIQDFGFGVSPKEQKEFS
jgi:hypothetical protein